MPVDYAFPPELNDQEAVAIAQYLADRPFQVTDIRRWGEQRLTAEEFAAAKSALLRITKNTRDDLVFLSARLCPACCRVAPLVSAAEVRQEQDFEQLHTVGEPSTVRIVSAWQRLEVFDCVWACVLHGTFSISSHRNIVVPSI